MMFRKKKRNGKVRIKPNIVKGSVADIRVFIVLAESLGWSKDPTYSVHATRFSTIYGYGNGVVGLTMNLNRKKKMYKVLNVVRYEAQLNKLGCKFQLPEDKEKVFKLLKSIDDTRD